MKREEGETRSRGEKRKDGRKEDETNGQEQEKEGAKLVKLEMRRSTRKEPTVGSRGDESR